MIDYTELKELVFKFSDNGIRYVEKTGATLIGRAPFVAPYAWVNAIFPTLSLEDIKDLEDSLGRQIPDDYKDFLMNFSNGLQVLNDNLTLYGLRNNYHRDEDDVWQPFDIRLSNKYAAPADATPEMLFIGSYKWDGSKIYIHSKTNTICFCSRDSSHPLKIWDSFITMLTLEIKRLYTLFDDSGRPLDKLFPKTPNIF